MIELQEGGKPVISFTNDAKERKSLYDQVAKGLKSKETHHTYLKAVQECQTLLSTVLEDSSSQEEDVSLSALNVLGLFMFIKPLSRSILPEKAKNIMAVLCDLLGVEKGERRNSVYTRVLWCLSTQQLPPAVWRESVPAVLSKVTILLACPDSISTSVDTEGLNVIKRCNEVAPEAFESRVMTMLYRGVIRILTSKSFRNYGVARSLLDQFSSANPKSLRKVLLHELSQGRLSAMIQLYLDKSHTRHQLLILQSWSLFVRHLGQMLNLASNNKFLNEMLKIVEMGFTAPVGQVQEAAYQGWTVLIEAFSSNPSLMESKKRMKLLMTPFVSLHSKLNDPVVCLARISSWWVLIRLALREKTYLKTSHMEEIVVPFLLSCVGVSPTETKRVLREAACVKLPQSNGQEEPALYCNPGNVSPEIPDMSSQSTALGVNLQPFSPLSPPPFSSTPAVHATEDGPLHTPSTHPPTSPPSSNPPPLLKVGRSNGLSVRTPLSSQSTPITHTRSTDDTSQPSLLLSGGRGMFTECLLCGLQVLLGLLGEPVTAIKGSRVTLDVEQPLWSYSDWLMSTYPGLVFGIVERVFSALERNGTQELRAALVTVWRGLATKVSDNCQRGVLGEDGRDRLIFCSHKLLCLLSLAADQPQLPGEDFGTMLEAFHMCINKLSDQDSFQDYLFSGRWRVTSSVDKQSQVYPVHFLLELLLRPKFAHLSEEGGPWFDLVWEIVANGMNSPALLKNREKVFTGIVSLARALPPSVFQLVEKFLVDRGIEGDSQDGSQEESHRDSQEESKENSGRVSLKGFQENGQEECVVLEAKGERGEAELCGVSKAGDKEVEKERASEGNEAEVQETLAGPPETVDTGSTSPHPFVIPESDLSPATPIHGVRKRTNDDTASLPPAKQLRLGSSPEQIDMTTSDDCQLEKKSERFEEPLSAGSRQQMVDDDSSQQLSPSDNSQQLFANESVHERSFKHSNGQQSPRDSCQQSSLSDSHLQSSPSDNRQQQSPNDSCEPQLPSDSSQQTVHSNQSRSNDNEKLEHAAECTDVEDENPLPVKSSVIQGGPSVDLSSLNTAASQHPHQMNAVYRDLGEGGAEGGMAKSTEEHRAGVSLSSSNTSPSGQMALATIEKKRKRRDNSSEGSESKRSKAHEDSDAAAQELAVAVASHESVIKGPVKASTNATHVQSDTAEPPPTSVHSMEKSLKETVTVDSVSDDNRLKGASVNTRDIAVEDQQENAPLESSQLDSSQELFGTPRAVEGQESELCAKRASDPVGSSLTHIEDVPQAESPSPQAGDALPLERSNVAQTGDSHHPHVAPTGSNSFGRRQHLAAKKRLASFQPRLSPVIRKSAVHRAEDKLAGEEEVLLCPGPSMAPSSSSSTSADALQRKRIVMPSPVLSRGARAVMFALSPSRTGVKGKVSNKTTSWTSPRYSRGSHNGILRVQSQFDTPVPRTPSRRVSFADPIEEQQSPGGSVTRVSGAKGGKKSLRSKPSFLQPRRLSEESKRDRTTDTECEESESQETDGSVVSLVQAGDTTKTVTAEEEHVSAVKDKEGLGLQSGYEAESMEVEAPNVTLHTPTSEDDTELSEHSEQPEVTTSSESKTQTVLKEDCTDCEEQMHSTAVPNDEASAEEVSSILESPMDAEEKEEEEVGETAEKEVNYHPSSSEQAAQEVVESNSMSAVEVHDAQEPALSPSTSDKEEAAQDQGCHGETEAVVSAHHASTQTGNIPLKQTLQSLKDYGMESLPTTELIDAQDTLYAVLSRVQRLLSERLSRGV